MEEKRQESRHRTFKGATIVYSNGQFTFQCLVKNLSATGARLEVSSTDGIPNRFQLTFEDRSPARACRVIWRTPTLLGVVFEPDG